MNITKFGHSCLLIEDSGARILIDPGVWSEGHTQVEEIDAIFVTHEHSDHCDVASLQKILGKNPEAQIYTNRGAGKQLEAAAIPYILFEGGEKRKVKDMVVEAFGREHAVIYQKSPCENTSLLINETLYHPGDAFFIPPKPVGILALPVCAPWLKMSEGLDFALSLKPKKSFPIHDGMLLHVGPYHRFPTNTLVPEAIEFFVPEIGKEFSL